MGDDLAKRMLSLAREDEFAARALLPLDGVANSIVGFHCHQAVEKALKSALASREVKFSNTHDLAGLAELCQRSGLDLPEGLQGIQHLAPYGFRCVMPPLRVTRSTASRPCAGPGRPSSGPPGLSARATREICGLHAHRTIAPIASRASVVAI